MNKDTVKTNILKRCIGKRYMVLSDAGYFLAEAIKVIDDSNLLLKNREGALVQASIFDIRNPNQEF